MHEVQLIVTLTGGLTAALLLGYITHRLGRSPIVGYLLGGTLLGPHTPGLVVDAGLAEQMAEIGVILLMFGVGLQFHVEELLAVRRIAVPGAIVRSLAASALGYAIAIAAGWSWQGAVGGQHGGAGPRAGGLTSADIAHTEEVIRSARDLNPQVRVLARATHLREVTALANAGVNDIFSGEGEVALALTVAILSRLGATAEQIDRERSRVRAELFGAVRS